MPDGRQGAADAERRWAHTALRRQLTPAVSAVPPRFHLTAARTGVPAPQPAKQALFTRDAIGFQALFRPCSQRRRPVLAPPSTRRPFTAKEGSTNFAVGPGWLERSTRQAQGQSQAAAAPHPAMSSEPTPAQAHPQHQPPQPALDPAAAAAAAPSAQQFSSQDGVRKTRKFEVKPVRAALRAWARGGGAACGRVVAHERVRCCAAAPAEAGQEAHVPGHRRPGRRRLAGRG